MFPEIPSSWSELSDEELQAWIDAAQAAAQEAAEGPLDAEAVSGLSELAGHVTAARTEQSQRVEESGRLAAEAQDSLATILGQEETEPEPELEPEPAPVEPEVPGGASPEEEVQTAEPGPENAPETPIEQIAAAAARRPRVSLANAAARVPASVAPRPSRRQGATILASAGAPDYRPGDQMNDLTTLVAAMLDRYDLLTPGPEESLPVGRIHSEYPSERQLSSRLDPFENQARMESVVTELIELRRDQLRNPGSGEALVAAGGLCAPTEGYYNVLQIADDATPVWNAFAKFGADRGGIRYVPPPSFADTAAAVGTVTAAQDALQSTAAVKACLNVACSGITEVTIIAAYLCLEFNNFQARTYPERVAALTADGAAQHARLVETIMLNAMASNSTAVTATSPFSSERDFFSRVLQAAAGFRSRQRVSRDFPLELYCPFWVPDLLNAGIIRSFTDDPFESMDTLAEFEADLAGMNVMPVWYRDSGTGKSQVIGSQAAGALNGFPSNMVMYITTPGAFVGLDGGDLNLGVVRDSILTMGSATGPVPGNRYRTFYENFVNAAYIGRECLEITMPTCDNGTYGAASTVTCANAV